MTAQPDNETPMRRKPGRPREYAARTSTAIRLAPDLHDRLSFAAAERDLSVNYLVNRAVERFLDRLIPVDEMRWTVDDPAVACTTESEADRA